ncbi:phosphotransferase [Streptomyces sp. NPDC058773]|uniref:phosphotransferase n=1 Tax=Streptomyces sp. NPDC058773 TaxID=3346632 RepID=UPI0036CCEB31
MSPIDNDALWTLVRPYTGEQHEVQPTARGNGSDVTALVTCDEGPVFVKACRNSPGGRRASIIRERLVNPYVRPVSPALQWHAADDEWIALGFEVIEGRASDFTPESRDLPDVVGIVEQIGELPLPGEADEWQETRWDRFADETDTQLFRGKTLLFTDINPDNLMMGYGRAWAVDWSWPTHGAAFIDPSCLIVQLIAAGHTPESAEHWAGSCKGWTDADTRAIDAFAAATARMNRAFADRNPDASWLGAMADAAQAWVDHRAR